MHNKTDEEVAVAVQAGNAEAFSVLVERYEDKMLRYARRFVSDQDDIADLVQDVFLRAYENIQGFNPKMRFSPWLYRIAHNRFVDELKRKDRAPLNFFDPDAIFPHPVAEETADSETMSRELATEMEKSLGKLDPKYREPLILYFYQELDYRQISEVLRIPVSTVGVRLKRAKAALRKIYSAQA